MNALSSVTENKVYKPVINILKLFIAFFQNFAKYYLTFFSKIKKLGKNFVEILPAIAVSSACIRL